MGLLAKTILVMVVKRGITWLGLCSWSTQNGLVPWVVLLSHWGLRVVPEAAWEELMLIICLLNEMLLVPIMNLFISISAVLNLK